MNQSHSDISYAKNRAKAICKKFEVALSNCTTLDAVKAGETHLKNALKILESIDRANAMKLDTCKRIAPNSNSQQQPCFCSTRQKRTCTVSLSKPNEEEIVECRDILQQIEIQVCEKCLQTNDEEHGDNNEWIQCSYCSMWCTVCALMWIQMIIFAASFVLSYIASCICIATYLDYFVQMFVHIIVTYNQLQYIHVYQQLNFNM